MRGRWLVASFLIYFTWLLLETVLWVTGPFELFESIDGLIHFVVSLNLFWALLRYGIRESRERYDTLSPGRWRICW